MARGDLRAKIRLEGDATGANAAIKSTERGMRGLGTRIKASALGITATLAAMAGAFRLVKTAAEQAGQATAFRAGLARQGVAADEFIAKLREVSDSQIANADLILSTNRALALGIKADDLPGLLAIATKASVKFGVSVSKAFEDITTGVGRAQPLILDNIGITLNATRVYKEFAASIDTTVESLTNAQRKQAIANAVLKQGAADVEAFTDVQDSLTRSINKSSAALSNLKQATGTVLGGLVQLASSGVTATSLAFIQGAEAVIKLGRAFLFVGRIIPGLTNQVADAEKKMKEWDDSIDGLQDRVKDLSRTLLKGGAATVSIGLGIKKVEQTSSLAAPAVDKLTAAVKENKEETEDAGENMEDFADGMDEARVRADQLRVGMDASNRALRVVGDQALITAAQFDKLADSAGRAAAVSAALDGGGTLSQGGTRINLSGHGSRLVAGVDNRSSYSLSEFGTGGRNNYIVQPDGSLRPR